MRRLRRFASLMLLPLGLQLALSASAIACVAPQSQASALGAAKPDMPGMQMPASPTDSSSSHKSGHLPCDGRSGGGDCQPLAACAAGALASSEFVSPEPAQPVHSAVRPLVVLAPASLAMAPELPPPRA